MPTISISTCPMVFAWNSCCSKSGFTCKPTHTNIDIPFSIKKTNFLTQKNSLMYVKKTVVCKTIHFHRETIDNHTIPKITSNMITTFARGLKDPPQRPARRFTTGHKERKQKVTQKMRKDLIIMENEK